jgi:hypothetical protein
MKIIEINALDNGAHNNQTYHGIVPDGWAIIPDDMVIPDTFPFVNIGVEDGVVVSMTAGVMPEVEHSPAEPTELEQLRADVDYIAMETGVEL